ncbi:MAG: aspartate/glutamate racemase family protein [Spirochaetia bacterium]|jgi:glutamate racemase|nr:aspartate/glutamate racemase family protein [Spirochaetia bacterium]
MTKTSEEPVIVFLDSGVGGLPYLGRTRGRIPWARLHYIADDAGFPYGTKTAGELETILLDRTKRLRALLLPDFLVIACNTASQTGLKALRAAHPDLPIIGTVPAVKPAAEQSPSGCIGIMATERTVADPYLDDLIARYATEARVVKLPAQELVSFVEHRYLESSAQERRKAVEPYVRELIGQGVDRVVLACTHFLHVQEDIAACAAALGAGDLKIVDSLEGVARRVEQLLGGSFTESPLGSPQTQGRFLLTGEPPFDPLYAVWAERFGLLSPEQL